MSKQAKKYLVGQKYGRLEIIKELNNDEFNRRIVECICDCGTIKPYLAARLIRVKSCGCLTTEKNTKHGLEGTPEYRCWNQMINRCCNEKNPSYKDYGGAGVAVFEIWISNPVDFINHIGKRPSADHSIDRIDSTNGYVPGNVRWASKSEQCYNRRQKRNSTSKFRGIHFNSQHKKWIATISTSKGKVHLGLFSDEEKAYSIYVDAYIKEHGCRPPYEDLGSSW